MRKLRLREVVACQHPLPRCPRRGLRVSGRIHSAWYCVWVAFPEKEKIVVEFLCTAG